MGNVRSEMSENTTDDIWWNPRNTNTTMEPPSEERIQHRAQLAQNLNEFRAELERKHEKRREIIAEKRKEMLELKEELEKVKKENELLKQRPIDNSAQIIRDLKDENEDLKLSVEKLKIQVKNGDDIVAKNKELRMCVAEMQSELQALNSELISIEQERLEYSKHISALKDVVRVTKDMLAIRENQITDLKNKVSSVEEILACKEMKIMSDGLREEYEKQLRNIRNLRVLYEERQKIDKKDKEHMQVQIDETKKLVEDEQKKNSELQDRILELEKDNSDKYDTINNLESDLGLSKAECKELQSEIDIINQLFSEVLLGFNNTQDLDLDKLIKIFKENHDLLTNIVANEESNSTAAALPKLLLDLVNQSNKNEDQDKAEKLDIENQNNSKLNSAEEIVENLPKVWKVLIELLSHQTPPNNELFNETDPCYTSIETPTGPKLKLSVSQTFIRLKDLILEKKFLEREMYRLKHLNTHLDCRLQDQEKRLELVSSELSKTWHTVGKMQRQNQQLHTHETILRYELQQKRKLLTELKEELQYCREKWVLAREKNDTTHREWKELRKEFASRKTKPTDDFNQSAESGYSDNKDSSEDEKGYESDVSEGKDEVELTDKVNHSLENSKTELVQNSEERHLIEVESSNDINSNIDSLAQNINECDIKTDVASNDNISNENSELNQQSVEIIQVIEEFNLNLQLETDKNIEKPNEINTGTIPKALPDKISRIEERLRRSEKDFKELSKCDVQSTSNNEIETCLDSKSQDNEPENIKLPDIQTIRKETGAIPKTTKHTRPCNKQTESSKNCKVIDETQSQHSSSPTPVENENINQSNIVAAEENNPPFVHNIDIENLPQSTVDILIRRERKLQNLEKQCKQLVTKVTNTSAKSITISNTLDSLHEMYGPSNNTVETPVNEEEAASNVVIEKVDNNNDSIVQENEATASNIEDTKTIEETDTDTSKSLTTEEKLSKREERLKRLEEEASDLVTKVTNTSQKRIDITNKLDNLHEIYGESSNSNNSESNTSTDETENSNKEE